MDVRCDDFWRWYKVVTIRGKDVWMRTLSASDESERTKAAMKAARLKRTAYLTEGSPEQKELFRAYEDVDRAELLAVIKAYQTEMSRSLSFREVQPKKDPPTPNDVTLDAALEAEEEWITEQVELVQRREDWAKEQIKTLMDIHEEKGDEELRETARDLQVSAFCTQVYMDEFEAQCVFRSCFKDEKFTKRTFRSTEHAAGVDHNVHQQLLEEYRQLDNYALDSESLKN